MIPVAGKMLALVLLVVVAGCSTSRSDEVPTKSHSLPNPTTSFVTTEGYSQIMKHGILTQGRKWKVERTIDSEGVHFNYILEPGQPSLHELGADPENENVDSETAV